MFSQKKRQLNIFMVILNIGLIFGLIAAFLVYDSDYKQKLYDQNIEDISNLNQSSADISYSFFSGREFKLRDIAKYVEANKLSVEDCLDFIYESNTDPDKIFELIGPDYIGYCIEKEKNGSYVELDYTSGYGDICEFFADNSSQADSQIVNFMPEFTDAYTAMTSFAMYNSIRLYDEAGEAVPYTLMIVSKSSDFTELISVNSGYDLLSEAIINVSGDYIIGSSTFKSNNFYKFLMTFNNLTLDQQKEIEAEMTANSRGTLSYLDGRGRDSVFVYTPVPGKQWYCITAVPVDSFHNSSMEFSFALLVVLIMLLLLAADLLYLASLNRQLRISAKNEKIASVAKTTFLSQMSHEIRTPMNAIIGMTKLAEDTSMSEETKGYLVKIENSSQYLLEVLNDILDMSRIESGRFELHPEWISYENLMLGCFDILEPEMKRKQIQFLRPEIERDGFTGQGMEVYCDPLRMKQILMNLLNNAVKFTPEGGTISLKVNTKMLDGTHQIKQIEISDSGCGMSPEFLQRIFQPFEQEQNPYSGIVQGTGLGLSLVKKIVTEMQGTITVASELKKGSTFTFSLPLECRYVQQTSKAEEKHDRKALAGSRVLLVEDHPLNREIAVKLLQKCEISVDQTMDGAQGVQAFANAAPGYYQAILMDIRMPVMNGLEATEKIRALERPDAKTIPIIAMTANAFDEDIRQTKAVGMNAHLAKPIEPNKLYAALDQYICAKNPSFQ